MCENCISGKTWDFYPFVISSNFFKSINWPCIVPWRQPCRMVHSLWYYLDKWPSAPHSKCPLFTGASMSKQSLALWIVDIITMPFKWALLWHATLWTMSPPHAHHLQGCHSRKSAVLFTVPYPGSRKLTSTLSVTWLCQLGSFHYCANLASFSPKLLVPHGIVVYVPLMILTTPGGWWESGCRRGKIES